MSADVKARQEFFKENPPPPRQGGGGIIQNYGGIGRMLRMGKMFDNREGAGSDKTGGGSPTSRGSSSESENLMKRVRLDERQQRNAARMLGQTV